MSWGFKEFETITSPGTDLFVVLDSSVSEGVRSHLLHDDYEAAKELGLPDGVPQSIRDYFDGARMLWLYGWFYYPFYSMAAVHSYLCMELALKERLKTDSVVLPRKQRKFAGMLRFAIEQEWFAPRGFGTIRRRIEREDQYVEEIADLGIPMPSVDRERTLHDDMVRLLGHIRSFRNTAAHPEGLTLLLPNMTYTQLEFTRDAISQLFP
jgi:hypothetical protein